MELAVIEIDLNGFINSILIPNKSILFNLLPNNGDNLFHYWDNSTNQKVISFLDRVFNTNFPLDIIITLNQSKVQLIAQKQSDSGAVIYCKYLQSDKVGNFTTSENQNEEDSYFIKQIKESEEVTLKRFTDNLPLVVFEVNAFEDGHFEFGFVNEEMHYFFPEFKKEEINKNNNLLFVRVLPDDLEKLKSSFNHISEFKTWDVEYRIVVNDEIKWLKGYGRPEPSNYGSMVTLCAYVQDITKQKQTEIALSKERSMLRALIDNLPVSIFVKDENGRKLMANKLDVDFMEVASEHDAIGKTDIEIFNNPQREYGYYEDLKVLHDKKPIIEQHGYVMKNTGEVIDIMVSKVPTFDEDGNVTGLIGICIDVTEKIRIEEQLKLIDFSFRKAATSIILVKEDASFYDFNDAAYNMLGYTKEEFSLLTVQDLDDEYPKEIWPQHWEILKSKGSHLVQTRHKKKDGSLIDVLIKTNVIQYRDIILNCAFITDISEKIENEERFRLVDFIFKNAATSIIYIREDATLFDFNDSFCELLGYSREEMSSLKIFDFDPEFNPEIWPEHWQQLREASTLFFLTKKKKKDGTIIDVEVSANMIKYGNLELNCAFITDTTERRKVEQDLEKSNKRYEYATIATSDAIWEADLVNNTMFLSSNYNSILGHSKYDYQDLHNNEWVKNVHPDDLPRVMQIGDDVIAGKLDKFQNEYRLRKSNGEYITVIDRGFPIKNEEGKVVSLIGSIQDVTQKRAEEERLKLWETVITNTSDAVIIRDANPLENGGLPVLYVNEAFTQMTGYTAEEVKGNTLSILVGPLTDKEERAKVRQAINKEESGEMRVINYKKNGDTFWVSASVFPLKDRFGKTTHWVSIQRDITRRKIAEAEREQLLNELIQNNKELKQFSYITTHNLRAPLTNLLSIAKMIDLTKITDKRTIALIDGFRKSTHHLSNTLNDLIEILIIKENQHLPTQEIGFSDVLHNVQVSIANTLAETKAEIESDFSLAPFVIFSGAYLESIFLNLITNSIKYAHPDRHPIIQIISTLDKEGNKKLIFSDNGLGMDLERVKDRIFGLYQRFHNHTNSKGIGLYLVHSQITSLGGKIEVASALNIGTTFTITFK